MTHNMAKVMQIFKCPLCGKLYNEKQQAINCLNSTDKPLFKVGDIVWFDYRFGWFDGDIRWVVNPRIGNGAYNLKPDELVALYYVITYIDQHEHKTRYHLFTKAMTGNQGYKSGWTYNAGHYKPKLIKAPEFVFLDSKDLIGQRAEHSLS